MKNPPTIITKWEGNIEWASYENGTYWWRTGNHKHMYLVSDTLGEGTAGHCVVCFEQAKPENQL